MWSRSALAFILALTLGCAKRQQSADCAPEVWEGECELLSVTKVEDKEFPVPHVVLEAAYRPLPNPRYPSYTPATLSERTFAKAQHELSLFDHLEAHTRVVCALPQAPSGSCAPARVKVSVPEFDPARADREDAAKVVTGCAQIESSSTQDRVRLAQRARTVMAQRLSFAEGSAALAPDADTIAREVAMVLRANPGIECLGIVGQIAAGESPGLAEERAKAVRDRVAAQGIDVSRLLTISATAKVFGSGAKPAEPDAADRRVGFAVLLERAPVP